MNELITNKIKELYSEIMDKPNQVLAIFNNFFGEDKVDLQGFPSIDEFEMWLDTTPIDRYISPFQTNIDEEIYKVCGKYPITQLDDITLIDDKILNTILEEISPYNIIPLLEDSIFKNIFILVHFPYVRVTNEFDKFVDITHLYAKVKISYNGLLKEGFYLNRAEYTDVQFNSGYMHSHVNGIPTYDFTQFQRPCTGVGPINDTMSNLKQNFNTDIWELFCLELNKFVEVESIIGVPYHRLEKIGTQSRGRTDREFKIANYNPLRGNELIKEFIPYFIKQGKLKFNYNRGYYSIGMSFTEYILTISNEFITWYNKKFNNKEVKYSFAYLKESNILKEVTINKDIIYYDNRNYSDVIPNNGAKICKFKGKDIFLNIINTDGENNNKSVILNVETALYILLKILYVINYRYGRTDKEDSQSNRVSEKVQYL